MNYCFCGGRRDERLTWRSLFFFFCAACEVEIAEKVVSSSGQCFFLVLILKARAILRKMY